MNKEQEELSFVYQVINDAFYEMIDKGYIKSHGRVVGWFVANAARILINEYSNVENGRRLQDHLSIKYGEDWWDYPLTDDENPHEKAPVEWREYVQRWIDMKNDVVSYVTDEKKKQWMDTIASFYESDLFKKINEEQYSSKKERFNKEFVQMFLGLFNEIKKDIRPLVSQLDFSWDENYVALLTSGC